MTPPPRPAATPPPIRSVLDNPKRFDGYRVVERIGRGAVGITYLVVSDEESSLVACVKAPHPVFANDPRLLEAFQNEALFASRLRHPNIVELRRVGKTADGRRYLLYPFVEGVDLGELIAGVRDAGEQLPWPLVATAAVQLASALEYAHTDQRGSGRYAEHPPTIHRDICPANILVGVSGVVSLTDFGIARALEHASLVPSLAGSGRVAYCAPERLLDGGAYDARADLFSLGVVLFEALTNARPFATESGSIAAHIERVRGEQPRVEALRQEYLPAHAGAVPRGLAQLVEVVHRLLEPNPDARYPSARELVDALHRIIIPVGTHRALAKTAEHHMPRWRRGVRIRTAETPAAPPSPNLWSSTNPDHLAAYLKGARFDAERDGIRVTSAGARRLLATATDAHADTVGLQRTVKLGPESAGSESTSSAGTFIDTAPMGSGPPFDMTVPDRPVFEQVEPEVVLTPPAVVDVSTRPANGQPVSSVFPTTSDQRPVFDPSDPQPPAEPNPGPAEPRSTPPGRAAHAQVATGLPALRVNTAGDLAAVAPSNPVTTKQTPPKGKALLLLAGTLLLGAAGACGIAALVTLSWAGTAWSTIANDHEPSRPGYGLDFGLEPLFNSHTRPILADIDGDGVQDIIGFGATLDRLLVAASGARADTLWTYALPADSIHQAEQALTFAAPAHHLVLHIDHGGTAIAIDGRTGTERWRTELGSPMQQNQPLPCTTADAAYVRSPQDFWLAIDLESGEHRDAGPPDGACDPQRPLGFRFRSEHRHNDSTGWEPNNYRAHLAGDSTTWRRGWLLPEQPRLLVEGSAIEPSGRSVAVLALFETHVGRRGRPRPAESPLWQTFVAQQPEVTVTEGLRNLTAHGEHLIVIYDMVRSRSDSPERVAAFDLRTGARVWDTALERNTGRVAFIEADADRVWVGHQALEILDRRTGEHLGRVGRW